MNILKKAFLNREQILEGLKNALITKQHIEEIAKERLEICKNCPIKGKNTFGVDVCDSSKSEDGKSGCGCLLRLKTRALSSSCPLGKWLAIMDPEAENELENNIDY
jgi:hypothetical protein